MNLQKRTLFFKIASSLNLFIFSISTIAWSAPEIRISDSILNTPHTTEGIVMPGDPQILNIPEALGQIRQRYWAETADAASQPLESQPVLFHIQDAHANPEAQKNTAAILDLLGTRHQIEAVFVEGAMGSLDSQRLLFFKDEPLSDQVADLLTREGVLGGAELYLLKQKKQGIPALGVENPSLYRQNLYAYRAVLAEKAFTDQFLGQVKADIVTRCSREFNKELKNFFREWLFYEDAPSELLRHLRVLENSAATTLAIDLKDARNQIEWPQLVRFIHLREEQGSLDTEKVSAERKRLADWLRSRKISENHARMIENREDLQSQDPRAFAEAFYDAMAPHGFRFSDYPALQKELGVTILKSEIRAEDLLLEMKLMTARVLDRLAGTFGEKKLIREYQDYLLLKNLFSLQLVDEEFENFLSRRQELEALLSQYSESDAVAMDVEDEVSSRRMFESSKPSMMRLIEQAAMFYKLARQREQSIHDNVRRQMREKGIAHAALITGGFHARGLQEMFRKEGVSYLEITPHISEIPEDSVYEDLMMLRGSLTRRSHANAPRFSDTALDIQLPDYAHNYLIYHALPAVGTVVAEEVRRGVSVTSLLSSISGSPAAKVFSMTMDSSSKIQLNGEMTEVTGKDGLSMPLFMTADGLKVGQSGGAIAAAPKTVLAEPEISGRIPHQQRAEMRGPGIWATLVNLADALRRAWKTEERRYPKANIGVPLRLESRRLLTGPGEAFYYRPYVVDHTPALIGPAVAGSSSERASSMVVSYGEGEAASYQQSDVNLLTPQQSILTGIHLVDRGDADHRTSKAASDSVAVPVRGSTFDYGGFSYVTALTPQDLQSRGTLVMTLEGAGEVGRVTLEFQSTPAAATGQGIKVRIPVTADIVSGKQIIAISVNQLSALPDLKSVQIVSEAVGKPLDGSITIGLRGTPLEIFGPSAVLKDADISGLDISKLAIVSLGTAQDTKVTKDFSKNQLTYEYNTNGLGFAGGGINANVSRLDLTNSAIVLSIRADHTPAKVEVISVNSSTGERHTRIANITNISKDGKLVYVLDQRGLQDGLEQKMVQFVQVIWEGTGKTGAAEVKIDLAPVSPNGTTGFLSADKAAVKFITPEGIVSEVATGVSSSALVTAKTFVSNDLFRINISNLTNVAALEIDTPTKIVRHIDGLGTLTYRSAPLVKEEGGVRYELDIAANRAKATVLENGQPLSSTSYIYARAILSEKPAPAGTVAIFSLVEGGRNFTVYGVRTLAPSTTFQWTDVNLLTPDQSILTGIGMIDTGSGANTVRAAGDSVLVPLSGNSYDFGGFYYQQELSKEQVKAKGHIIFALEAKGVVGQVFVEFQSFAPQIKDRIKVKIPVQIDETTGKAVFAVSADDLSALPNLKYIQVVAERATTQPLNGSVVIGLRGQPFEIFSADASLNPSNVTALPKAGLDSTYAPDAVRVTRTLTDRGAHMEYQMGPLGSWVTLGFVYDNFNTPPYEAADLSGFPDFIFSVTSPKSTIKLEVKDANGGIATVLITGLTPYRESIFSIPASALVRASRVASPAAAALDLSHVRNVNIVLEQVNNQRSTADFYVQPGPATPAPFTQADLEKLIREELLAGKTLWKVQAVETGREDLVAAIASETSTGPHHVFVYNTRGEQKLRTVSNLYTADLTIDDTGKIAVVKGQGTGFWKVSIYPLDGSSAVAVERSVYSNSIPQQPVVRIRDEAGENLTAELYSGVNTAGGIQITVRADESGRIQIVRENTHYVPEDVLAAAARPVSNPGFRIVTRLNSASATSANYDLYTAEGAYVTSFTKSFYAGRSSGSSAALPDVSADGRYAVMAYQSRSLYTGHDLQNTTLVVYDIAAKRSLTQVPVESVDNQALKTVVDARFLPGSSTLARVVFQTGEAEVYNVTTGQKVVVRSAAIASRLTNYFPPEGKPFQVDSRNPQQVKITELPEVIAVYTGGAATVFSKLVNTPHGELQVYQYSVRGNDNLVVFNAATGYVQQDFTQGLRAGTVQFSASGNQIAAAGGVNSVYLVAYREFSQTGKAGVVGLPLSTQTNRTQHAQNLIFESETSLIVEARTVTTTPQGVVTGEIWGDVFRLDLGKSPVAIQLLNPLDVNRDGVIAPIDALQIINYLNSGRTDYVRAFDTNGDGSIAPIDVLLIINELNNRPANAPEGEAPVAVMRAEGEGSEVVVQYESGKTERFDGATLKLLAEPSLINIKDIPGFSREFEGTRKVTDDGRYGILWTGSAAYHSAIVFAIVYDLSDGRLVGIGTEGTQDSSVSERVLRGSSYQFNNADRKLTIRAGSADFVLAIKEADGAKFLREHNYNHQPITIETRGDKDVVLLQGQVLNSQPAGTVKDALLYDATLLVVLKDGAILKPYLTPSALPRFEGELLSYGVYPNGWVKLSLRQENKITTYVVDVTLSEIIHKRVAEMPEIPAGYGPGTIRKTADSYVVTAGGLQLGPQHEITRIQIAVPQGWQAPAFDTVALSPNRAVLQAPYGQEFVTLSNGVEARLTDSLAKRFRIGAEESEDTIPDFILVNGTPVPVRIEATTPNPLGWRYFNVFFTPQGLKNDGTDEIKVVSIYENKLLTTNYYLSGDRQVWANFGEDGASNIKFESRLGVTGTNGYVVVPTGLAAGTKVISAYFNAQGTQFFITAEGGSTTTLNVPGVSRVPVLSNPDFYYSERQVASYESVYDILSAAGVVATVIKRQVYTVVGGGVTEITGVPDVSPDGALAVAGQWLSSPFGRRGEPSQHISILDTATGNVIRRIQLPSPGVQGNEAQERTNRVVSVRFVPNSSSLLQVIYPSGVVEQYDARTGQKVAHLTYAPALSNKNYAFRTERAGETIQRPGSNVQRIFLLNIVKGETSQLTVVDHPSYMDVSTGGTYALVASYIPEGAQTGFQRSQSEIYVRNLTSGTSGKIVLADHKAVSLVRFAAGSDNRIEVTYADGTKAVYDAATLKPVTGLPAGYTRAVSNANYAFSMERAGETIQRPGSDVQRIFLLNIAKGETSQLTVVDHPTYMDVSTGGTYALVASYIPEGAQTAFVRKQSEIYVKNLVTGVRGKIELPDGKAVSLVRFAAGTDNRIEVTYADGTKAVYDAATGNPVSKVPEGAILLKYVSTPHGRLMVYQYTQRSNDALVIFNPRTGYIQQDSAQGLDRNLISFSADGNQMAVAGGVNRVYLIAYREFSQAGKTAVVNLPLNTETGRTQHAANFIFENEKSLIVEARTTVTTPEGVVTGEKWGDTFRLDLGKTPVQVTRLDPLDTNRDGHITPIDALRIINYLNSGRTDYVRALDTNNDGHISPIDILRVINHLNNRSLNAPEGEAPVSVTKAEGKSGKVTVTYESGKVEYFNGRTLKLLRSKTAAPRQEIPAIKTGVKTPAGRINLAPAFYIPPDAAGLILGAGQMNVPQFPVRQRPDQESVARVPQTQPSWLESGARFYGGSAVREPDAVVGGQTPLGHVRVEYYHEMQENQVVHSFVIRIRDVEGREHVLTYKLRAPKETPPIRNLKLEGVKVIGEGKELFDIENLLHEDAVDAAIAEPLDVDAIRYGFDTDELMHLGSFAFLGGVLLHDRKPREKEAGNKETKYRSELRPVLGETAAVVLARHLARYPYSLEAIRQTSRMAYGTLGYAHRVNDEVLRALLDAVVPVIAKAAELDAASFRDEIESGVAAMEQLTASGILTMDGEGSVILSTAGRIEDRKVLLLAAIPFMAALAARKESGGYAQSFKLVGENAKILKDAVYSLNSGLSATERNVVSQLVDFASEPGISLEDTVRAVIRDEEKRGRAVAVSLQGSETSALSTVLANILKSIENPEELSVSKNPEQLVKTAEAYVARALLLADLASKLRLNAELLKKQPDQIAVLIREYFAQKLPDIVVNVAGDGSFELSISVVAKQLAVFKDAQRKLSASA